MTDNTELKPCPKRHISWFSCGAASAVATKIMLQEVDDLIIAYSEIKEEHPDNKRFLADCVRWYNRPITIMGNDKYDRSIYKVFEKVKYISGVKGATCTRLLKKQVRIDFQQDGDIQYFGYTHDKKDMDRADRFIDANPDVDARFPLIERGITKADCLSMIKDAGIELPEMYKLGYHNNNCIGCVKGAAGYWNKIREDFPETFERMSETEEKIGASICKIEHGTRGTDDYWIERPRLKDLPLDAGDYPNEPDIECSFFCHMEKGKYENE